MSNLKIEDYEGFTTVSRARSSNVATIIVDEAHGLISGDTVTITGVSGTGYNDSDVEVTVTDSVTFTYANTGGDEGTTGDTGGTVSPNFTMPYNPNTIEFNTTKFVDQRALPYAFTFLGYTSAIKAPILITLNGHFSGTNKNLNYRRLARKVNVPRLFKVYYENSHDKFYIAGGSSIQKVPTGTRPLFVDYVSSFLSPFGVLFDATQKSGNSSSAEENEGDIIVPIEKITGAVTNGVAVTIKDKNNNGFTFTPDATGTMTYHIVTIVSEDNTTYLAEYGYVEVDGAKQVIKHANTSGDIILKLNPSESLNDILTGGSVSGITPTFYFRDGWASD